MEALILKNSDNKIRERVLNKVELKKWVDYARENNSIILYDSAYEAFITEKGKVEITHTIVNEDFQGQGLAGRLTMALAEKLRSDNLKAELTCSYAVKWFSKHREYEDVLIDPLAEYKKSEAGNKACNLPKHKAQ